MNLVQVIDNNTGKLFEFDYDSTVYSIEYTFNDNPSEDNNKELWDYDFEYRIVEFKEKSGYAIIITHWQQEGMVLGCPDCALHQATSVFLYENEGKVADANKEMTSLIDEYTSQFGTISEMQHSKRNHFYESLTKIQMPQKAHHYFFDRLKQDGYIKLEVNKYV